ncbi:MAG: hypothetical protein SVT56_08880, partial [Chloroflexota bacterium]|nr:hypothetical protein [Chloroflexota bacterium]
DDMSMILSGIDAGLAFYRPDYSGPLTGDNLKYLGLASGKVSTYLRYGVPVVMNETGLYAEEVQRYKLGCVVCNIDKISEKLTEIKNNDYSQNAKSYFSDNLDFNIYADDVLLNILSVVNNS